MLKNNGFFGKTMVFLENNVFFKKQCSFDTTSHLIYFYYMHSIKIKTINVLHKLSFHNTIPYRSHSLIGHVIQEY